jgi:hypothetical protein
MSSSEPVTSSSGLWLRAASLATAVAVGVFIGAMALAIAAYPGGSWTVPSEPGFSLARNFWCDLLRSHAINGLGNATSKRWASLAFGALAVGSLPFWCAAASLFQPHRRWLVATLGATAAMGLGLMAALPSDRYPVAHGAVALAAGASGLLAAAMSSALRLGGERRFAMRRVAAALTLSLSALNAGLYVYVAYLRGPETVALPIVQKLATLSLVIWMSITVRRAAAGVISR